MARPGPRNASARKAHYKKGRYSPTRESWLDLPWLGIVRYRNPERPSDTTEDDPEALYGDGISLVFIPRSGNRRAELTLTLGSYTEAELDALKTILNDTIEAARPTCRERDRRAREAFERNRDDSFQRLYREVPRVIVRERHVGQYDEGVRVGPAGAAVVDGAADEEVEPAGGTVRDDSGAVAERDPEGSGAQDDGAAADESAVVGDVGRDA